MRNCTDVVKEEAQQIREGLLDYSTLMASTSSRFEWKTCIEPGQEGTKEGVLGQFNNYFLHWSESYTDLVDTFVMNGMSLDEAETTAMEEATGETACTENLAGGATFWFVLMTTIGYGNAVPVTNAGRILVFTLGFVSILSFTGIIAQAGQIIIVIAEDLFSRSRFQKIQALKRPIPGAMFWLALFLGFVTLQAAIYKRKFFKDTGTDIDWMDAFWFAFITQTTVGFGDAYIRHDTRTVPSIMYAPLSFLITFTMLGNFLAKFAEFVIKTMEKPGFAFENLFTILEQRRGEGRL